MKDWNLEDSNRTIEYVTKVGREKANKMLKYMVDNAKETTLGLDINNMLYMYSKNKKLFMKAKNLYAGKPIISIYHMSEEELKDRMEAVKLVS